MQKITAAEKKGRTVRDKSGGVLAGRLFYTLTAFIGAALILISLPLLVINGIIIINSYVNPNQVPDAFGYKPFIVLSGSMEPTIMTGDLAIIRETDPSTLQVGDVIAFKDGNSVIIHRIIEEQTIDGARQFTTQGDNNNTRDSKLVPYSAVEGKYLLRLPSLGDIAMFLQTPVGLILFMLIPFVLFILYDRYRRNVLEKRDTEENARLREQLEERERQLAARAAGGTRLTGTRPEREDPTEISPCPIPVPDDLETQFNLLMEETQQRQPAPASKPGGAATALLEREVPPDSTSEYTPSTSAVRSGIGDLSTAADTAAADWPAPEQPVRNLGAMSAAEKKAMLEQLLAENQRLKMPPEPEPDPLELEIQRILEENRMLQEERGE